MKIKLLLIVTLSLLFSACSAKKINDNVDSITSDVSKLFEDGLDKSNK
ncbi:MAG: hypothetical protein ABGW85_02635 [Sulfurimonas sp.]